MTSPLRFCVLLLALVAATSPASGQQRDTESSTPSPDEQILALFSSAGKAPGSFPAYLQIADLSKQPGVEFGGQLAATLDAELGLYDEAIADYPLGSDKTRTPSLPANNDSVADAAATIGRLARNRRIVIINEGHHVAQTRALFLDLLPELRAEGFDYYCAETLDASKIEALQQHGYPVRNSGIYSREPIFSEALRSALRNGYSLCAYEYEGHGHAQQDRETGQAENIAKLLREHPDARILVHVGWHHVRRDKTVDNARPMAAELKRLTGIEPLTVDQTLLRPESTRERENKAYRPLLARLGGATRASVFVDARGKPWSLEPKAYDVSVILPDFAPAHGRAGWLWQIPGKQVVTDFDASCAGQFPCAIEARYANESDDAVPADVVVRMRADAPAPAFALFAGDYKLVTIGADGRTLGTGQLHVAPPSNTAPP